MEPRRKVYLEPDEVALEPKWGDIDGLFDFLRERSVKWRLDPVFQNIVVTDRGAVRALTTTFQCENVTDHVRRFLRRKQGVRVVACNDFGGMLLYNVADDLLYHVDATSFEVSPESDFGVIYCFRGLGRAAAHGKPLEFGSTAEAVAAFRDAARKAQRRWVSQRRKAAGTPAGQSGS